MSKSRLVLHQIGPNHGERTAMTSSEQENGSDVGSNDAGAVILENPLIPSASVELSPFESLPLELLDQIAAEVFRCNGDWRCDVCYGHGHRNAVTILARLGPAFVAPARRVLYDRVRLDAFRKLQWYLDSPATKGGEYTTRELFVVGRGNKGKEAREAAAVVEKVLGHQSEALQVLEAIAVHFVESSSIARLSGIVSLNLRHSSLLCSHAKISRFQLKKLTLYNTILPHPFFHALYASSADSLVDLDIQNITQRGDNPIIALPPLPFRFPNLTRLRFTESSFDLRDSLRHCRQLQNAEIIRTSPFLLAQLHHELASLPSPTVTRLIIDILQLDRTRISIPDVDKILALPSIRNVKTVTVISFEEVVDYFEYTWDRSQYHARGIKVTMCEDQDPNAVYSEDEDEDELSEWDSEEDSDFAVEEPRAQLSLLDID